MVRPTLITPLNKQLIYGLELPTSPGTDAATFTREGFRALTTRVQQTTEQQKERAGVPFSLVGVELLQQYGQTDATFALRSDGAVALSLLALCGNGSEAIGAPVGGLTPHTGTPSAKTVAMNTFTLYHDNGERDASGNATNLEKLGFGSVASVALAFQLSGVTTGAIQWMAKAPVSGQTKPIITNYVGNPTDSPMYPGKRGLPQGATFTIYNSAGVAYAAKIQSGTFNLTRAISPEYQMGSIDCYDLVPDELLLAGGFTAIFDGSASASIRRDYLSFTELGDSTHVHQIMQTFADTSSIALNFYPIRITDATIDDSQRVKIQCSFMSYTDIGKLNAATPAATILKNIVVTNAITALWTA